MSIRDRLNQNPGKTVLIVVAFVTVAVGVVVWQVLASRRTFPDKLPEHFYTIDDGKTFFAANSENVPPFDYEGKQAVRAYVYEANGKRFVAYLERYTPEARQAMISKKGVTPQTQIYGRELKQPGSAAWVKSGNFAAVAQITDVKSPDGQGTPEPVEP
jgi:hypothetical protein